MKLKQLLTEIIAEEEKIIPNSLDGTFYIEYFISKSESGVKYNVEIRRPGEKVGNAFGYENVKKDNGDVSKMITNGLEQCEVNEILENIKKINFEEKFDHVANDIYTNYEGITVGVNEDGRTIKMICCVYEERGGFIRNNEYVIIGHDDTYFINLDTMEIEEWCHR